MIVRGSLLIAVMIHVDCISKYTCISSRSKTPSCVSNHVISQITFSGVLSEPRVGFVIRMVLSCGFAR